MGKTPYRKAYSHIGKDGKERFYKEAPKKRYKQPSHKRLFIMGANNVKMDYLNALYKSAVSDFDDSKFVCVEEDGSLKLISKNSYMKKFTDVGKNPYKKAVAKICPETKKVLKEYTSIREAYKELGVSKHNNCISIAIKTRKKMYGFYWEYL